MAPEADVVFIPDELVDVLAAQDDYVRATRRGCIERASGRGCVEELSLPSSAANAASSPRTGSPGEAGMPDVAIAVMSEHGYHGTSVRDIAVWAGGNSAARYHHFPPKRAVLATSMERGIGVLLVRSQAALAAAAELPETRLQALVDSQVLFHREGQQETLRGTSELRAPRGASAQRAPGQADPPPAPVRQRGGRRHRPRDVHRADPAGRLADDRRDACPDGELVLDRRAAEQVGDRAALPAARAGHGGGPVGLPPREGVG